MKCAYLKLIEDTLAYLKSNIDVEITEPGSLPLPLPLPPPPLFVPPISPQKKPKVKKGKAPLSPQKKTTPPISPSKAKKKGEKPSLFSLNVPSIPPVESQKKWRELLQKLSPQLHLHTAVPTDEKAKRIKMAWKEKETTPDIPLLYQGTPHRLFLRELTKAMTTVFYPSKIVEIAPFEREKKWDLFLGLKQLKLIIAPEHILFGAKQLLPFYRENPQQGTYFLGSVPLLLLPDLSLYLKDPSLKCSLWNVICQTLASISSPQSS